MTPPLGWERAQIGDLCDLINGKAFKPTDWARSGLPIIRIQNLNRPDAEFNFCDAEVDQRFLVEPGELLFAWSGTPGTSFGAHVWNGPRAVLNQHIFRVLFNQAAVDRDFFKCAINSTLDELINKAHGGVGLAHVTKGKFEATEVPLPPLAEQRRIVAKLDALTARLARARAELDRVPVLAEHMRDKGLQSAFDGTLFGEDKHGWETVPFSQAGEIASNLVDPATIADLPHVAPNHIRSGRPTLLPYTTIREDGVTSGKHRFFAGQIIYSKIRPYLRKAVLVDFEGGCSADMYPINPRCHTKYLLYWVLSPQFTWLATRHEGRTVLPKINQSALNAIPTPLAPPEEQERIADALDVIFARADRLEAEAARARALLDRLEAAILARAFRGELVPQDPAEEPATALLARIRAQRAAAPKAKRGRRSQEPADA